MPYVLAFLFLSFASVTHAQGPGLYVEQLGPESIERRNQVAEEGESRTKLDGEGENGKEAHAGQQVTIQQGGEDILGLTDLGRASNVANSGSITIQPPQN